MTVKERKIDKLGRVTIPIDFCRKNQIFRWQEVEVSLEYGKVCIRKFTNENLCERQFVGVVKEIDELNRVVIPKEYRNLLNFELGDRVCIEVGTNTIRVFKKI